MRRALTDEERGFAGNLRRNMQETMRRNGWGISKFCEVAGLPRSTVAPIYYGQSLPGTITLHRIAQAMDMNMSEAVGETSPGESRRTWQETVRMVASGDPEVERSLDVLGRALADGLSERAGKGRAAEPGANAKRVRCAETGEVFPSIKDASARTGVSRNCLSTAARTGKEAKGLHYQFIE